MTESKHVVGPKWFVALLVLSVLALVPVWAQPPPAATPAPGAGAAAAGGQGGQRGMMMQAMYLQRAWTIVCFDLKISDEQLLKLRPGFQAAYDKQQAATKQAREQQNWEALGAVMQQVRQELDGALQGALTPEQMTQFQKQQQQMMQGGMGRRGGMGGMGGQ